jgi:UDPglucose 6-dehydrogenase
MRVGIIGLGIVGGAMYRALRTAGQPVCGFDADASKSVHSAKEVFACDTVLIAVPTPADEEGNCDLSAVDVVFEEAASRACGGLLVLRSTVPVGTTDALIAKYPTLRIGFSPEFLRQATADQDLAREPLRIFGGREEDAGQYFRLLPGSPTHEKLAEIVMSPAEAEMTKLFLNAFAAVKTVFAAEMSLLAERFGADWSTVAAAAELEGRVGKGYLGGIGPDGRRGFGGRCLPKDARMLAKLIGEGCLLEKGLAINDRLRGERGGEMVNGE